MTLLTDRFSTSPDRTDRGTRVRIASLIAVAVLLASAPFLLSSFGVVLLTRVLILGLLACSLDVLVGVTGLPSLGHAAPYGVGGYAAGLAAIHVTDVGPVQLLVGLVAGGVAAAIFGFLAVRTRGVYFLMVTLAFGEIVFSLAQSWDSVTGGSNGLFGVPQIRPLPGMSPLELEGYVYWYVLVSTAVAFYVLYRLASSPLGRSLAGVRENGARMHGLGYPVANYKYVAFVVSGSVAGYAGALTVGQQGFIAPQDIGFQVSAIALIAVIIGGQGTLIGAFVGAGIVILVRDELASYLTGSASLMLGAVFIVVVYALPKGVVGTLAHQWPRWRRVVRAGGEVDAR